MTSEAGKRFPFAPFPKGWFQVAYSTDVEPGAIIGMCYFGRRLICYRGDSGTPYVLDAYCPHLGADIAVGGTVDDDCVVCPFHGWRFDGSGSNVDIPYAKSVSRTARLRAWPTAERAGIEQDIPIWEAKIYRNHPQLARGEGAITEFRSWAGQSYEEANA